MECNGDFDRREGRGKGREGGEKGVTGGGEEGNYMETFESFRLMFFLKDNDKGEWNI